MLFLFEKKCNKFNLHANYFLNHIVNNLVYVNFIKFGF